MFGLKSYNPRMGVVLSFFVFVWGNLWANDTYSQPQDVTVNVVNSKKAPIPGAEVEIFQYFGGMNSTQFKGETNHEGKKRFLGVSFKGHAYLVARHADFAPVIHFLSIAGQDKVTTTVRLAPAIDVFVNVSSPDGKPLAGAEVTRLEFSSKLTGEKHFANHDFFMAMMKNDGSQHQSDAKGRLRLPPLPSDAVLSITIAHPKFAVGKIKDVRVSELFDSNIELKKGTTVEAYFFGAPQVMKKLEGTRVRLKTHDRKHNGLVHSFPIQSGKSEFSLIPGRYDSLKLSSLTDLVITPSLPSSIQMAEFANILDLDRIQKRFVVRELRTVKGRAVTTNRKPVRDLMLRVEYENLYINEKGEQQVVKEHPTVTNIVTTNHEGEFECKLPKGKASITAWWESGFYSRPKKLELIYEDQPELPNYVVRPMPTIKGIVVNEAGKPLPNAILRLVDHTDNYFFADQKGRFEVPVSAFDFDDEGKTTTKFKTLSAFDLGSRLCYMDSIDITNEEVISNLQVKMVSHPVGWLLNRLKEKSDQEMERMFAESKDAGKRFEKFMRRREDIKASHRFAPDLADGRWIGSIGSRSLREYRGKYILLDFWFIGCGPCEREIPNLKLVHQKFKNRGFSVVGIHTAGQDAKIVQKYAEIRKIGYPMVVDRFDEPITKSYEPLGLQAYPTYFLINPDGEIDWDAEIRGRMLETIRDRILKLEESKSTTKD